MKTKAKRLLAMLLAIMMLLPITLTANAAGNSSGDTSVSSPSISDVSQILNMISYSDYLAKYESVGKGDENITVDITDNKYVVDGVESTIPLTEKVIDGETGMGILVPDKGTISFTVNVPIGLGY